MDKSNVFTVLPMAQSISLKAGQVYEGSITVVNPSDATADFPYQANVTPYGVSNEGYEADLVTDSDRTAISKWIEIEEPTGVVHPNESKEIKFTIKVPNNAPAGGQYATIAVSSNPDEGSNDGVTIQNVYEIASIIYATVDGEIVHEGQIVENRIPGFVVSTPITIGAYLRNDGNVHENATFTITVSDFFTGRVILPTENNDGQYVETIMPETERYVEREISDVPTLGVIKVTQAINYNGETSTIEREIVICPIWFMAIIFLTIAAIITAITLIIKKHRRNKAAALR